VQNLARLLASAGYSVHYRGKWHMSRGADMEDPTTEDIAAYGFAGWVPPEAGENTDPAGFGGGCASWDAVYTQQAVDFLHSTAADGPQPWALVVSLVNPHDLLAYPRTWDQAEEGGCTNYAPAAPGCFQQGIELPPTLGEDLAANFKPTAQQQTLQLLNVGLGVLTTEAAQSRYVNFYAYLQKVVDAHLGAVLDALEAKPAVRDNTSSSALPITASWGCHTAGCGRKCSTPMRKICACRWSLPTPCSFPSRCRRRRWRRWSI
jgi:choline-sulfatase